MTRRIAILGSTGSIGVQTVGLVAGQEVEVAALTGGRNVALLAEQARALRPEVAVVADDDLLSDLRDALAGSGIAAAAGRAALIEAAGRDADWTMSAIVGAAGLEPGLAAVEQGGTLALANKETMVCAGPLVMARARATGATLLPVDSEHSAIFQGLVGEDVAAVERVIVTASGGAFRDWPLDRLADATPDQAATHPNWDMGRRITVDSASMFNKALELIEAKELFGLAPDRIEAVVHPESLVHAVVCYRDGAMIAHMGPPDMRHAIGYALNWPERRRIDVARLDLAAIGQLTFRAADPVRWPALALARRVMEAGGHAGAVFNAAKEIALDAFLDGRIRFTDMAAVVEDVLDRWLAERHHDAAISLDSVAAADHLGRTRAAEAVARRTT